MPPCQPGGMAGGIGLFRFLGTSFLSSFSRIARFHAAPRGGSLEGLKARYLRCASM